MKTARAISVVLMLGLAAACGGSTEDGASGGAGGSSGSSGSSGSGGSAATGGSSAGGSGGSAAAGGSSGSGGTGAVSSWADCTAPGQCSLFATNCCGGYCSEVPLSSFIAINHSKLPEVNGQLCDDLVACPDCITHPNPHYLAACRANTCTAIDIRNDALSACNTSDDCRLRWGAGCCESCSSFSGELIALAKNANLENEVCDPLAGACPPCAPQPFPADAKAECLAGQCQVTWQAQPGG